jgi:basic membrane protein A
MRRAFAGVCLAAFVAGWAGGCAKPKEAAPEKPLVGLVFDVGGLGDKSFNDAAYRGLLAARDSLGIDFTIIEPPSGADREPALRQLASGPAILVFGIGFLFTDDIRRMAEEFPSKRFACVDYSLQENEVLPPNLVALRFREEEGAFLVGAIAALTSVDGKVGFVGGMDIPLIHRFQAGYEAGARAAKPSAQVLVSYAGLTDAAFKDPAKGKELALAQYEAGADVIFHASGSTGLGVFEAARQLRRFAIGVDSDQAAEAPGRVLTSMIKRVDVAVTETIRQTLAGEAPSGVREFGLADRGIDYVYDSTNESLISAETRTRVEELRGEIIAGRITVPRTR